MLTDKEREDYERAAVALETHEALPFEDSFVGMAPWAVIAWKAWDVLNDREPVGTHIREIDNHAASLLRYCIEKGGGLP